MKDRQSFFLAIPNRYITFYEFSEMVEWCKLNIDNIGNYYNGSWGISNQQDFIFKFEEDRIHFVLMFSGSINK